MKDCKYEKLIDDYLFNRLSEAKTREFDEHIFNCSSCFQLLQEKSEIISVIRQEFDRIFHDLQTVKSTEKAPLAQRLFGLMTTRQWAAAALSAALIVVGAVSIIPNLKKDVPQFYLNDDMVRGRTITLISDAIPTQLRWLRVGENIEYKVSIYNHELLWEATTNENYLHLPEEVKAKMKPGVEYYYQVKAFSPEGTLVAQSSKVQLPTIKE